MIDDALGFFSEVIPNKKHPVKFLEVVGRGIHILIKEWDESYWGICV